MPKLIAFLGNPGNEYKKTRHNAGFMLCDFVSTDMSWQKKFCGTFTKHGDIIYLKPETLMNLSGNSVVQACCFFGVDAGGVLVVHDDLETPFGIVRIQNGGGLGGHNGLRSIRQNLGTQDFWRLRIGIGRPERQDIASFVVSRFSEEQEKQLPQILKQAASLLEDWSRK